MRSAPFQHFVVTNSLEQLLFLTRIKCCSSQNLRNEKIFRKTFRRASKCVCAINVFGRQSLAFGCARSNSIVPVCLRFVKFFRVCVGKYQVPQKIRHCAFGCALSNSIASCAFICAWSNYFVFSRNGVSFC